MKRDPRYDLIRPMYDTGRINSFNDIFRYIPKTIVATDIGKKVDRFTILISKIEGFKLEELVIIGHLCHLNESEIFRLAENEYFKQKATINKLKV